jgi:8-oxo-dGTP pyrophosphatase MutT (NUDIX family)
MNMAEDVAKNADWPKIVSRRATRLSPWVEIVERAVEFTPGAKPDIYHAVNQTDYVAIVARTPDGAIPIVRQYRPALETFTWELPAGMLEQGEQPMDCCRRELQEETGFPAQKVPALGSYASCTARLSNQIHTFFVETGPRSEHPAVEAGIELKLVSMDELAKLILAKEFVLQMHIGALMLAGMHGYIDFAGFRPAMRI